MKEFTIKGRFFGDKTFPSLNNYLSEVGRNPKAGGRLKRQYVMIATNAIRRDLKRCYPALHLCRTEKGSEAGQREHLRPGRQVHRGRTAGLRHDPGR